MNYHDFLSLYQAKVDRFGSNYPSRDELKRFYGEYCIDASRHMDSDTRKKLEDVGVALLRNRQGRPAKDELSPQQVIAVLRSLNDTAWIMIADDLETPAKATAQKSLSRWIEQKVTEEKMTPGQAAYFIEQTGVDNEVDGQVIPDRQSLKKAYAREQAKKN